MLSIAVDVQGSDAVRPWVEKFGVTFSVAVDPADVFGAAFGLKAIPVSFLVDEVGIIRLQGGGPSKEFCAQVEAILAEPLSRVRGPSSESVTALSLQDLRARVAVAPADTAAQLALAHELERARDVAGALAACAAAGATSPKDAAIPFTQGMILLRQGRTNAAVAQFRVARDLDPGNWRIRKQIWAVEHPDKFYGPQGIDWDWQREQLKQETP